MREGLTLATPTKTHDTLSAILCFSDKGTKRLQVMADETVLAAALRNGIKLRSECTLGTCGTCKAQCADGEYELETDDGLTVMERRRRYVLTCVMHLHSDCRLNFAYAYPEETENQQRSIAGRIELVEMVSESVCRLVIQLGVGKTFEFIPGQYANVTVPGTSETRSYSFANSRQPSDRAEFFVRLLEDGAMSNFLRQAARVGDVITLSGPFGSFYLDEVTAPILMVAGGTGLAPMLSMLDHLVNAGPSEHQVKLLFGVGRLQDLFGVERLERYRQQLPNFNYEIAVAEPHPAWHGNIGFVTSLLDARDVTEKVEVYVCGPPAMTEATASWLVHHGVRADDIRTEKFLPS